ncbi:MAG: lantibiotic dehydratase [Polyangia bacterium]
MSHLQPADFFVLRTPALPWDIISGWSDGIAVPDTDRATGALDSAVAHDEELLRARLRELVRRPEVREALFVASPSLSAKLQLWLEGDDGEAARLVEPALVRYLVRMAGRPTPFGLFAGYSLGVAGARSTLTVPPLSTCRRTTRLNVDVIYALANAIAERSAHRGAIRYRPNSALYVVGQRLRYLATRMNPTSPNKIARACTLRETAANEFTSVAVAAARERSDGATIDEISAALTSRFVGVAHEDAKSYVVALIETGLFSASLLPPVTGVDPAVHLLTELRKLPSAGAETEMLQRALDDLAALDQPGAADREAICVRVAQTMRALGAEADSSTLLKVDLRKPAARPVLKQSVLRHIADAVEKLAPLTPPIADAPMRSFMQAFELRYQTREVPLLEALDCETGIGFEQSEVESSSLIRGLRCDQPATPGEWQPRDAFVLEKLCAALREGRDEIELSDDDLERLATRDKPLPAGQTAIVTIAADSLEALDRDEFRLCFAGGAHTTSAALLGRFLDDDPELACHVGSLLRLEEDHDRDALHAEIAHHLEGPVGPVKAATNISRRPLLRDYEIDVGNASGAPVERRIPLDDLLLSLRGGRLILRSRSLGRRVVPHLSTAHSFQQPGVAAYRFLAQLQLQAVQPAAPWSWGPALARAPFLPRVRYGRVILALRTWRLPGDRLTGVRKLHGAARVMAMRGLRKEQRIPRHVCLVDGDNVLPVDLENVLSLDGLLTACKGMTAAQLREPFAGPDGLIARGGDGAFHHELLIPLVRPAKERPAPAVQLVPPRPRQPTPDRARRPGGDWLYAKLYCGGATADRLVANVVSPAVERWRRAGSVEQWFFIRYADPDRHVRVRLHGDPEMLWRQVAPELLASVSAVPEVHRVVLDTYDPEVERYGGERALPLAHALFDADSDLAADVVRAFRTDTNARWRVALMSMAALLDDFGLELDRRRDLVARERDRWARTLGAGAEVARQLGENYRRIRVETEQLLRCPPQVYEHCVAAIRRRSGVARNVAAQLRQLEQHGALSLPIAEIAASHLHMAANRLFRSSANNHEHALYDLLFRLYDGALARERKSGALRAPTLPGVRESVGDAGR